MNINIFQIFYNEETRKLLDPAFLPLDNSGSERVDWYEYWPIRTVLLNQTFADADYVGFFSPQFFGKTGFVGAQVRALVERSGGEVVAFSPLFYEIARRQNSFLQGELFQPGLLSVSQKLLEVIGLGLDLKSLWQDQTRTIYSNYFVARYSFWKKWFGYCEQIFAICERNDTQIALDLNAFVPHRRKKDRYQMKVFVIERIISALLENLNMNAVSNFNFIHQRQEHDQGLRGLGKVPPDYARYFFLDALKGQYLKTGQTPYLNLYNHHLRNS